MNSIALASAIVALSFSGSAVARPHARSHAAPHGAVQAKIEYCQICHGESGAGFYGYYAIPRLAGQQPGYIENQLRDYASGLRHNPIMSGVARGVTPGMYGAIAAHFHSLNAAPLGGRSGGNVALGREIFANGLPESNVPACSACHGPDAHGARQIPRLAGQLPVYLVKTLSNWGRERGRQSAGGLSAIMVPTTHNLTAAQISAVAAYVGGLR
ncbi:cytochrome c [Rhodoblastus acidophilus]|uniref:c-type cytochrome n=1 Tax=Candidatus Rhodoblastus alkanivorans TaxID=2954117 RepID=UPI001FA9B18F|nr:c-type cytochrome [Candidatus Rhodoblastus alkanivorans]MCI4678025.1 cytochrome c [Candidatus Rhodoblastus alkanivorans]